MTVPKFKHANRIYAGQAQTECTIVFWLCTQTGEEMPLIWLWRPINVRLRLYARCKCAHTHTEHLEFIQCDDTKFHSQNFLHEIHFFISDYDFHIFSYYSYPNFSVFR